MSFITKKQYSDIVNTFTVLDEQYWVFFKIYDRVIRGKETTMEYLNYTGDPYVSLLIKNAYLYKDKELNNLLDYPITIDISKKGIALLEHKIGDWEFSNLTAYSNAACTNVDDISLLLDLIEDFGTNISNTELTTITLNQLRVSKCVEVCKDSANYSLYDQILDMLGYLNTNELTTEIDIKKLRDDLKSLVKDLQSLKEKVINLSDEK